MHACILKTPGVNLTPSAIVESLARRVHELDVATSCVICMDATRCVALNPCNHLVYCAECMESNENDKTCPVCRQTYTAHSFVFT